MIRRSWAWFALLIAVAGGLPLPARGDGTSTSGLGFLRIREGVRAAAMGDAFSALADDGSTLHWNPAGVMQLVGGQVYGEHAVWFDQTGYDFVEFTDRLVPDALTLGLGVSSYQDKWDSTDPESPNHMPSVFGGGIAFQGALAWRAGPAADLGINLKVIRTGLAGYWTTAYGGDVGVLFHLVEDSWTFSMVANDLGSSYLFKVGSAPLEYETFPSSFRVGSSWRALDEEGKIFSLNMDGEWPIDTKNSGFSKPNGGIGFELWLFHTLALRGGYRIRPTDLPWNGAFTFGGGFRYWIWTFDYAYQPYSELGVVHRASVTLDFRADAWSDLKFAKKPPSKPTPLPPATPVVLYRTSTPVVVYATPTAVMTYPTPTPVVVVVAPTPSKPPVEYLKPTPVAPAPKPSPTIEAAAAVPPPTDLALETEGDKSFLRWQNPRQLTTMQGYNVYFGQSPTGPWARLNAGAVLRDTRVPINVPRGKIVYLVVRTVDSSGNESVNSEVVSNSATRPTSVVRPPTPSGVTMQLTDQQTTVTWQTPRNPSVVGYHVYSSLTHGGPYGRLTKSPRTTNSVSIHTGPKHYYFVVTSVDLNGVESEYSVEAIQTGLPVPTAAPPMPTATVKPLPAPKGVKAIEDKGRIYLQWQALPQGSLGVNVYIHAEGVPPRKYNTAPVRETRYSLSKLNQGAMCYFVVKFVYPEGEGPGSPEVSIFVPKVAPSKTPTRTLSPTITPTPTETPIYFQPPKAPKLMGGSGGDKSVTLRWAPHPDKNVVGFNVYRSTTSGSGYEKIARRVKGTFATVTGLSNGVTYYFVLTAENAARQESAFSNEVSMSPSP